MCTVHFEGCSKLTPNLACEIEILEMGACMYILTPKGELSHGWSI